MRTAFKVATVFTGAAACAAAFVPTAAATAATTTKTQQIVPDIIVKDCTGGSTRSVHFYYPPSGDHGPICIGETGTASLHGTAFSAFCAGNNSGWFLHSGLKQPFKAGNNFFFVSPSAQPVTKVDISHFGGRATCPF